MSLLLSAYRALGTAGVALGIPRVVLRGRPDERRERLGFVPAAGGANPLWIHAASVGETAAAAALLAELRARESSSPIALSTMTRTARDRARLLEPDFGPFHPPLDAPAPVRRALDRLEPRALVVLETELWPVLIQELSHRRLPWAVASARVSERSFARMRRLGGVVRSLIATVTAVAARTDADAARFTELGAPEEAVRVTGDLKEDRPVPEWSGPAGEVPCWIAACTRPGEEEAVLGALRRVTSRVPRGELILAPRHPERFEAAAALVTGEGLPLRRWSQGGSAAAPASPAPTGWSVTLIDEMGVLEPAYSRAAVAFVGGSLSPFRGHSPLEAAAAGRPVVMGPHVENCQDVVDRLTAVGALTTVRGAEDLAAAVADALTDPESAETAGRAARDVVAASSGAARRTVDYLRERGVG